MLLLLLQNRDITSVLLGGYGTKSTSGGAAMQIVCTLHFTKLYFTQTLLQYALRDD
jgi:hypothetical protein